MSRFEGAVEVTEEEPVSRFEANAKSRFESAKEIKEEAQPETSPEIDESTLSETDKQILADAKRLQAKLNETDPITGTNKDTVRELVKGNKVEQPKYDGKVFFKSLPKDVQNEMLLLKSNEQQTNSKIPVVVSRDDITNLSQEEFRDLEKKAWAAKEEKRVAKYRKTLHGKLDAEFRPVVEDVKNLPANIESGFWHGASSTERLFSNIAKISDDIAQWGGTKIGELGAWITGKDYKEVEGDPSWLKKSADYLAELSVKDAMYAESVAPKKQGVLGKTTAGVVKAISADIPQFMTAGKFFGPTMGMGITEGVKNIHHGKEKAIEEGIKGAMFGKLLEQGKYLNTAQRVGYMGGTGAGVAALEGASVDDIAASGFTMAMLGGMHKGSTDPMMPKSPMMMYNPVLTGYQKLAKEVLAKVGEKTGISDFYHTMGSLRNSPNYPEYYKNRGLGLGEKGRTEELSEKTYKETRDIDAETSSQMVDFARKGQINKKQAPNDTIISEIKESMETYNTQKFNETIESLNKLKKSEVDKIHEEVLGYSDPSLSKTQKIKDIEQKYINKVLNKSRLNNLSDERSTRPDIQGEQISAQQPRIIDKTQKEFDINKISEKHRKILEEVKEEYQKLGKDAVRHGLMSKETYEKHKDKYLPAEYLQYLLPESIQGTFNSQKFRNYKEATLKDNYTEYGMRMKELLGEIRDYGFLAARGLSQQGATIAKLNFLEKISGFEDMVMPESIINYKGKNVSVKALGEQKTAYQIRLGEAKGSERKAIQDEIKLIDKAIELQDSKMAIRQANPKAMRKWVRIPDKKEWGNLRGAFIRKEVYNDIKSEYTQMPPEAGNFQKVFGQGGWLEKATRVWKTMKVPLNPPSQVRNFISNASLFQLSGESFAEMPSLLLQAAKEIRTGGEYWQIAKKYGIKDTGFGAVETYKIEKAFLDYINKQKGKTLSKENMIMMGSKFMDAIRTKGVKEVGSYYQYNEALFKTAKIIAEMKRGKSEAQAVRAAQEALFDYSHVPSSIKYMRKNFFGAPFITFYYKSLPKMIETAAVNPQRFLPYLLLVEYMKEAAMREFNWSDDDHERVANSMAGWMQDKGHMFFLPTKDEYGRIVPVDYSYFLPWGQMVEMMNETKNANLSGLLNTAGLMTGPVIDIASAIKTNVDPFTGQEIIDKNKPGKDQVWDLMNYVTKLAAPTWLTDRGFAGKMLEAINKEVDPKTGDPKVTVGQAALRAVGINTYPTDPREQRRRNIRKFNYEVSDIRRNMIKALRNKNLINKPEKKKEIRETYRRLLKNKIDERSKYIMDSRLPDNL